MYYQDHNSGALKAAILLHGLGANSDSWQFQIPALTNAGYRVIVPDMFGFGKSPYENRKNTIELMAEDVKELMDKLGIQKASIIGLSMGGAIAQIFALRYPEKVEKLLLANTAARFAGKISGSIYKLFKRIFVMTCLPRRFGANMVSKYVFPKAEQAEIRKEFFNQIMMSNRTAYFDSVRSIVKHDAREGLKKIKIPTLIVGGRLDMVTPLFHQKWLSENIENAKLVIFEGAGHVSSVDSATEFNKEMLDFLES